MIEERQNIKGIVNVATIEITPATQEKSVTPSKEIQEVKPDRGYVGLSKVIVDKVTSEVDSNILPSNIKEGVSILGVDGNVVELKGETKEVTPTKNEQTILPSEGKNALTSVIVNAVDSTIDRNILSNNIRQGVEILGVQGWLVPLKGEERTITPSTSQQTITPSDGKNAITSAIVNAVTKDIDSNIKAENIKKDTEILGVIGTLEGQKEEQTKTIEPNFSNGNVIVTPDENKVLNSVTITKDNDLTPSNIKSGVEVFGVTGTFDKTLGAKTITSNGTYKASDDNLDGYSQVEVETSGVDINEYYDLTKKNQGNATSYIKTVPKFDTSGYTNFSLFFSGFSNMEIPPLLDTSNATNMYNMFRDCTALKQIPLFNTSKVTDMSAMFSNCYNLESISVLDTSNVTNMQSTFSKCQKLKTIPLLNTSKVTQMNYFMQNCDSMTSIPLIDTSSVTSMYGSFQNCKNLEVFPQLDTSNVTEARMLFSGCLELKKVPLLNANKMNWISNMFQSCPYLEELGGLANLGNGYTATSANDYDRKMNLSECTRLTHDSLINVINNLYDIAAKELKTQRLELGSTNLAKLTAEEIAIATNKGWSVS